MGKGGRTRGGIYVPCTYSHASKSYLTLGDSGLCCVHCDVFGALINSLPVLVGYEMTEGDHSPEHTSDTSTNYDSFLN